MVEYKWYNYVSESCEQARVSRGIAKCGFNFVLFIVCLFIAKRDERSSQRFVRRYLVHRTIHMDIPTHVYVEILISHTLKVGTRLLKSKTAV